MSDIYLSLTETPAVVTLSQPVVASVMVNTVTVANVVSVNVVTMPAINVTAAVSGGLTNAELRASAVTVALDAASLAALESVTVTVGNVTIGSSVTISNFPATQTIAGTVTANVFGYDYPNDSIAQIPVRDYGEGFVTGGKAIPALIGNEYGGFNDANKMPVSGTVTVGNSVTIGSLPAISGTVTANGGDFAKIPAAETLPPAKAIRIGFGTDENWTGVGLGASGAPLPVAIFDAAGATDGIGFTNIGGFSYANVNVGNSVTVGSLPVQLSTTTIGGTARLNVTLSSATTLGATVPSYGNLYGGSDGTNFRAINVDSSGRTVVTGSVGVAQLPRVTFIDGSGSVTTANSAITVFASSTTRSYLLVQVTTGSAFVNVGATATTVNGINLTAGQGYAWETTIPQGLVSLISTTTSSRWVAKEA